MTLAAKGFSIIKATLMAKGYHLSAYQEITFLNPIKHPKLVKLQDCRDDSDTVVLMFRTASPRESAQVYM